MGDRDASWLVILTPGGFGRFVTEVAMHGASTPPEVLGELAPAHGIELLGPPGTLP